MIRFAEVALGSGGGVFCARCRPHHEAECYAPAGDVIASIEATAAGWEGAPGPNIAFMGPEPFGHPELPALVGAAVSAGVQRLRLDTDAAGLRSVNNAAGVLSAGVRHVRFTVLGGSPGIHDALAGAPGALDATLAGVATLLGAATVDETLVSVTAVIPVCRHNLHDLPAAVAVAVEAGAESVLVRLEDGGADLTGAMPWLTSACDTGVVNGAWVEVEGVPFCLLPGYELHLTDVVRSRGGAKAPVCAECPLDPVCAGGPARAAADLLASFVPPPGAARLSAAVRRARGEEAEDA
jgi:hypothetical protein